MLKTHGNRLLSPDLLEAPAVGSPAAEPSAKPTSGIASIRQQITEASAPKAEPVPVVAKAAPLAVPDLAEEIVSPESTKTNAKAPNPKASPDEIAEYTKNLSKKSQERFKELSHKQAEAIVSERMKSEKLLTPEIEAKMTKYAEDNGRLLAELRQLGVERSPEYMQKFVERPKAIETALAKIAKDYEIPESEFISVVKSGDRKKQNELLETVGIIDRNETAQYILELAKIKADHDVVFKDPETAQRLLDEKRTQQTKAYVDKLQSDRRSSLEKDVLPVVIDQELNALGIFEGDEGEALKADIVTNIKTLNDFDLERMTPKDRAALIASAFASKPLSVTVKAQKERIVELEQKLAKYDKGTPALGGKSSTAPTEEPKMTFMEKLKAGKLDPVTGR